MKVYDRNLHFSSPFFDITDDNKAWYVMQSVVFKVYIYSVNVAMHIGTMIDSTDIFTM